MLEFLRKYCQGCTAIQEDIHSVVLSFHAGLVPEFLRKYCQGCTAVQEDIHSVILLFHAGLVPEFLRKYRRGGGGDGRQRAPSGPTFFDWWFSKPAVKARPRPPGAPVQVSSCLGVGV